MASRGGRGAGRGRRGGGNASIIAIAQKMGTTATEIRKNVKASYEPEPLFPAHLVPRPTKLSQDEIDMVKYYRGLRTRILEDTPFYIIPKKRQIDDDEDDGIRRYRDKYKPKKSSVQGLRALPVDETLFPEELRPVFQGGGAATAVVHRKKYNLDDFLETANEDYTLEQGEEEIQGPTRAEIIRNEEDDELEPIPADPDADEDLNEDDYGEDYFDNGEGDFDDYADAGDDDER